MLDSHSDARLRSVCIHEHAHATVARHFGHYARVVVTPKPNADSRRREWSGQCAVPLMDMVDPRTRRMVALAGSVANLLDNCPELGPWEAADALEDYGDYTLSDTDAALANGYSEDDVEDCVALVRSLWKRIVYEAELQWKLERSH